MTVASISPDLDRRRWGALALVIAAQFMVILGGVLTSYLSWSWIVFINVPVGAVVIALTPWLLRGGRNEPAHRGFDVAGAASITAGLMLLVYALTRATQHGWGSPSTIGLL